jgi:undecaprenyl-diphosphatase
MFEAIILGIIQGLTEFIPISSSAHIRLAGEVFPNAIDPGAMFTAITQIGTELAVLIFFIKDIVLFIQVTLPSTFKTHYLISSSPSPIIGEIVNFSST